MLVCSHPWYHLSPQGNSNITTDSSLPSCPSAPPDHPRAPCHFPHVLALSPLRSTPHLPHQVLSPRYAEHLVMAQRQPRARGRPSGSVFSTPVLCNTRQVLLDLQEPWCPHLGNGGPIVPTLGAVCRPDEARLSTPGTSQLDIIRRERKVSPQDSYTLSLGNSFYFYQRGPLGPAECSSSPPTPWPALKRSSEGEKKSPGPPTWASVRPHTPHHKRNEGWCPEEAPSKSCRVTSSSGPDPRPLCPEMPATGRGLPAASCGDAKILLPSPATCPGWARSKM